MLGLRLRGHRVRAAFVLHPAHLIFSSIFVFLLVAFVLSSRAWVTVAVEGVRASCLSSASLLATVRFATPIGQNQPVSAKHLTAHSRRRDNGQWHQSKHLPLTQSHRQAANLPNVRPASATSPSIPHHLETGLPFFMFSNAANPAMV